MRVKALGFRTTGRTGTSARPHAHAYRRGENVPTCERTNGRARKGERAEVEVEDRRENGEAHEVYTDFFLSYSVLCLAREPAWHSERDVIDRTFHRALRHARASFSHYCGRIPGMLISVSGKQCSPKQLGHANRAYGECALSLLIGEEEVLLKDG